MDFKGKRMLTIGAGISGFAASLLAKRQGAKVVLSDAKQEKDIKQDFTPLRDAGIRLAFGPQDNSLLDGMDYVLLSPAVPERIPLVKEARRRGIEVTTEIEMAYRLAESPILAVTGTNGKTTTVTLLGLLMKTKYGDDKTGVGGNIGIPLVDEVMRIADGGCIAAEISSYQLEATKEFRPHIAAILNVTPDHVVRHGSIEVYQQMKEKIFAQQTKDDFLVLNYDNDRTRKMEERAKNTNVMFFSRQEKLEQGAFVDGDMLTIRLDGKTVKLCTTGELGIKGGHNVENALAASLMAYLAGADPEKMRVVLTSFTGVEHRIEPVTSINGVMYYNDSKATNTDSAIKALETFDGHIVLIAGGDDKMTDLTEFMGLVNERVDDLILVGDAAQRFYKAAKAAGFSMSHVYGAGYSMERAVEIAKGLAHEPQVVLLSPACASFDMYDSFEQRGRDFKEIVRRLAGKEA